MTNALKPAIDHRDTVDWQAQQTRQGLEAWGGGGADTLFGHLTTINYTLFWRGGEWGVKCQTHTPAKA